MIDTHIHLDFESYDTDRPAVIDRFFAQGGKAILNIGTDIKRFKLALEIAKANEHIYAALGFHPQEGVDVYYETGSMDFVDELKKFIAEKKVVAIGEIGLDYFHPSAKNYELKINDEIKKIQKQIFIKQLDLARKDKMPVAIHSWDAQDDCWKILKDYLDLKIVFHCYGKNIPLEYTQKLLSHDNIYFSFTGNVTFPRPGKSGSEIFEHIKLIPLEKIMVETDGPFLTPAPFRGQRNEPAYIKYVIEKIAQIKGLSKDEVEIITDQTALKFFKLH